MDSFNILHKYTHNYPMSRGWWMLAVVNHFLTLTHVAPGDFVVSQAIRLPREYPPFTGGRPIRLQEDAICILHVSGMSCDFWSLLSSKRYVSKLKAKECYSIRLWINKERVLNTYFINTSHTVFGIFRYSPFGHIVDHYS